MWKEDIIPTKDLVFDLWQNTIYTIVQANLALWLIPVSMFNLLAPFKMEWDASWAIAKNKETRSKSDVARKNAARKKYVAALRTFIKACVNYNPLISDQYREQMGLKILDKNPTPSPQPTTTPEVKMQAGNGHQIVLTYRQQTLAEGDTRPRAKPEHVHYMELCYKIGDPAPATPDDCTKTAIISRTPHYMNVSAADSGKRLYAYGRWVNNRNQPGPWSTVLSMIIP